jgi:hypothetical protein
MHMLQIIVKNILQNSVSDRGPAARSGRLQKVCCLKNH